jgi:hypothetical protein
MKEIIKTLSLLFTSCCYTEQELKEMGVQL